MAAPRRHVLSIDDGPFRKFRDPDVLVVGVVTAGAGLVEGILTTRVPVDGEDVTERLSAWIAASRFRPALRAVLLNGIAIAGLSLIDLPALSAATGLPVIAVHRKRTGDGDLIAALEAAGFPHRIPLVGRAGPSRACGAVFVTSSGLAADEVDAIIAAESGKSKLPDGLRLAHLIARGVSEGESRGRP